MDMPTAAEVRAWGPPLFTWADYGLGAPSGADPDVLDIRVQWSVGTLFAVTGRTLDSITSIEEVSIAQRVIAAFTITEALGGGEAALAVLEAPWLKSFTAGSYSETRFSPSELGGGGSKTPPYPWPLWVLLWALMTEEKREEWMWRLGGARPPAATFVEPDWSGDSGWGPSAWGPGIDPNRGW